MQIKPLSQNTIRLIGSSQILIDPAAIVKELIDNSLDAGATSLFVEVSSNTVDTIQVSDNGHGIPPEDRKMICRRNCTSKLRSYEEINTAGQKYLGFRGEALAAAAELSGSFTITTRVDGEEVASCIRLKQCGEVEDEKLCSHAPGTTVRLLDVFQTLPVRKQVILKTPLRYINKMRRYLQGHAFARPGVRLSLKILQSVRNQENWVYVPKGLSLEMRDTVCKIVGLHCASQCEEAVLQADGFSFRAFLPSTSCDFSKIQGPGQFISVDLRPVSAQRGIFKSMIKIFKNHISKFYAEKLRDPFLCINILCPSGSYDPNVDPAKDFVIFEDGTKVLRLMTELFNSFYEPLDNPFTMPAALSTTTDVLMDSIPESSPARSPRPMFGWVSPHECLEATDEITKVKRLKQCMSPEIVPTDHCPRSCRDHPSCSVKILSRPLNITNQNGGQLPSPQASPSPVRRLELVANLAEDYSHCSVGNEASSQQETAKSASREDRRYRYMPLQQLQLPAFFHPLHDTQVSPSSSPVQRTKRLASPPRRGHSFLKTWGAAASQPDQFSAMEANLVPEHLQNDWKTHTVVYKSRSLTRICDIEKQMVKLGSYCIGRISGQTTLASLADLKPSMEEVKIWNARINAYLA